MMSNQSSPAAILDGYDESKLPPMPDRKKQLIQHLVRQTDNYYSLLKPNALTNLFVFNRYILNVDGVGDEKTNKAELGQFHKKLCTMVTDDRKKKKLILIPRGHLKSTLITIGYSLQSIIANPNIRILILNATWQMAVDFLSEIKRHLVQNPEIGVLYPEVVELARRPDEWTQDRITLPRTDTGIKGPTVWAAGIESNLVGSHPDLIIFDDVVNRDNTNTVEQKEKVKLRYKDALDLLEPGGQLIVIGTRWAEDDLYGWIMDKENEIYRGYDIQVERAYEGNLETGENFKAIWPEKFSQPELLGRLREKGWFEFSAQYLNDPTPAEDAVFRKDQFRYFNEIDIRGKDFTKVLTIDPAISIEKDADFTAMVVSAIDTFGNIFVLDIVRGHFKPSEIIERVFYINEIWHPQQVGIETVAYQKALSYALKDEMQKRRRYLPIVELLPHERSKDQRIKALQPQYESRKVFHRDKKECKNMIFLENELVMFPRGAKDDIIDAFSYALELLHPPRKKVTRYQHQYLY